MINTRPVNGVWWVLAFILWSTLLFELTIFWYFESTNWYDLITCFILLYGSALVWGHNTAFVLRHNYEKKLSHLLVTSALFALTSHILNFLGSTQTAYNDTVHLLFVLMMLYFAYSKHELTKNRKEFLRATFPIQQTSAESYFVKDGWRCLFAGIKRPTLLSTDLSPEKVKHVLMLRQEILASYVLSTLACIYLITLNTFPNKFGFDVESGWIIEGFAVLFISLGNIISWI